MFYFKYPIYSMPGKLQNLPSPGTSHNIHLIPPQSQRFTTVESFAQTIKPRTYRSRLLVFSLLIGPSASIGPLKRGQPYRQNCF